MKKPKVPIIIPYKSSEGPILKLYYPLQKNITGQIDYANVIIFFR